MFLFMTSIAGFKKTVWVYYRRSGRDLAWRHTADPYRILVSEIMLQQTQVLRVAPYYKKFIKRFPDFASLAKAKTADVLRSWQGLGYNRRALALQKLAKLVAEQHHGKLPRDRAALESLPGIGPYTAGAIRTFAFNDPEIFIETNIRRVFIHFFFPKKKKVHDDEIKKLIARTLDSKNPKKWYWALMDYGAMLGATAVKNPNRRSAHYAKQSRFAGSDRELRGKILRLALAHKKISVQEIVARIPEPQKRIQKIMQALEKEGFCHFELREKSRVISRNRDLSLTSLKLGRSGQDSR
jgi:A/G-specific adenine glycosylase